MSEQGDYKETAAYLGVISNLAFEISKHADGMARWCYACPFTITPEIHKIMRAEIDLLLAPLGRAADALGIVKKSSPIYDPIRADGEKTTQLAKARMEELAKKAMEPRP